MPYKADPERVEEAIRQAKARKILQELRDSSDPEEKQAYRELIKGFNQKALEWLRSPNQPTHTQAQFDALFVAGHPKLQVDLGQDRTSTVDQKIIANLTNTWTRDEPVLSLVFKQAWDEMAENHKEDATGNSQVTQLLNRLSYHQTGLPTRLKAEVEHAKSSLRDTGIDAAHRLSLYRANYLDRTDSQDVTRGPAFTNPVTDHGTIPVGHTITPQQERDFQSEAERQRLHPQPPAPIPTSGDTVPRDRSPLGLSPRTLFELDIANLAQKLGQKDFDELSKTDLSAYDVPTLERLHTWVKNKVADQQRGRSQ
jgi:hypothetical protein